MDGARWLRGLAWNAVVGIVVLLVVREWFVPGMPLLWWPLLLSVVFGFPGAIAAVLIHVYVQG